MRGQLDGRENEGQILMIGRKLCTMKTRNGTKVLLGDLIDVRFVKENVRSCIAFLYTPSI